MWESPRAVGGSQGGFIFEDSPMSAGESKDDKLSPGPGGMRGGASGESHGIHGILRYYVILYFIRSYALNLFGVHLYIILMFQ